MNDKRYHNALNENYKLHWYVIKKVLGRGGFGITYLAVDTNLDRKVAIKEFLPSELCYRDDTDSVNPMETDSKFQYDWGLERFLVEAKTLAKFEHPNIVRVIAVFEENNTGYMVMNYEEGDELQTLLAKAKTLDEDFLLLILFPLLDGLEKIHNAGFIHRDIKPQNIMLRSNGTPILIDFGSARQAFGGKTKTLTSLVSPGYAPFEQYYTKGDKQGPWTDIYSLAATLYRCVSGKSPLSAVDRSEGIVHGSGDYFVSAAELGKGRYSEQFLKAIDRGLGFKPEERPQSIAEWRKDFQGLQQYDADTSINENEIPTVAAAIKQPVQDAKTDKSEKSKRKIPVYVIGIILIALLLFVEIDQHMISGYLETLNKEITIPVQDEQTKTINTLLGKAHIALDSSQLIVPDQENAFYYYSEVLKLDPGNKLALNGLDQIFIKLFDKTKIAIASGDYESARKYLAKAEEIKPQTEIIRLSQKVLDDKLAEQEKLTAEQTKQEKLLQEIKEKEGQITKFLNQAKSNLEEQQYITPKGNNARYHYKQVLLLQPENQDAIAGLTEIARVYLTKTEQAITSKDYSLANEYLAIVQETNPDDKEIDRQRQSFATQISQSVKENQLKVKQANQVNDLLASAETDIREFRLTWPAGNNALEKYQEVLKIDPQNETAQTGISTISNKYVALARDEINNGNYDKAYQHLIAAKKLAPDSDNIKNMLHEIELLKNNNEKEEQLALEQQRIEEEKKRIAEEEQRRKQEEQLRKDAEQQKKVEALQAEIKRMEAEKANQQEVSERSKIFSVSINQIESKYQAMGINEGNLANDTAALLRNSGFKVLQQDSPSVDNGSNIEIVFNATDDSTGKLVQWDATVSAKYLGNVVWTENFQKKGKPRELYGVTVHTEAIDDLKPARETILEMVGKFIYQYRNNWPPK